MKDKVFSFSETKAIMQPPELIKKQSLPMQLFRKISIFISYPLSRLNVSPHAVNLFWIFLGIVASFILWKGTYSAILLGVILFQASLLLDLVDGELARYYFKKFKVKSDVLGHYLDTTGHYITKSLFFIGLGVGIASRFNNNIYLYAGIFTCFFLLVENFKPKIYENLIYKKKFDELKEKTTDYTPERSKLVALFFDFIRIDLLSLILWAAIFDFTNYVLLFYFAAFGVQTIMHYVKSIKYFDSFSIKAK